MQNSHSLLRSSSDIFLSFFLGVFIHARAMLHAWEKILVTKAGKRSTADAAVSSQKISVATLRWLHPLLLWTTCTTTLCQLIRQRNKGLPNFNAMTMLAEIPPWTRRSRELGLLLHVKLVFFQHLSCENSEEKTHVKWYKLDTHENIKACHNAIYAKHV